MYDLTKVMIIGSHQIDSTSEVLGLLLSPFKTSEIPLTTDTNAMKSLLEKPLPETCIRSLS